MLTQKQTYQQVLRAVRSVQTSPGRYRQYGLVLTLAIMLSMGLVGTAAATQTSTSTHYSVTETQFGGGSVEHQCSTNYCAKSSAGDTTVGNASSDNYSAQFGSNTTAEPRLEVIVETPSATQDLGVLDDTHTGTATATIKVLTYLSNGYVMQLTGAAPNQGSHTISRLTTPSTSQAGAEQFGVNLVNNSAPNIGADPVKVPSNASAASYVTSDYGGADLFTYADGDIVAQDTDANGETDYTMSMIMNVSNVTPGGRYTGSFSAVVVPTY